MPDPLLAALIGLAGGLAAGLLGIGGGAIFVPGMVLLLDVHQPIAQGVSLATIVVTAFVGSVQHARNGAIDFALARWMVPGTLALGLLGGLLAGTLDAHTLRRIYGVVVFFVALRMIAAAVWRPAPPRPHAAPQEEAVGP